MSRSQVTSAPSTHQSNSHAGIEHKENIWSSLLSSVSGGKRLPEKNLIVLGKLGIIYTFRCAYLDL